MLLFFQCEQHNQITTITSNKNDKKKPNRHKSQRFRDFAVRKFAIKTNNQTFEYKLHTYYNKILTVKSYNIYICFLFVFFFKILISHLIYFFYSSFFSFSFLLGPLCWYLKQPLSFKTWDTILDLLNAIWICNSILRLHTLHFKDVFGICKGLRGSALIDCHFVFSFFLMTLFFCALFFSDLFFYFAVCNTKSCVRTKET